MRRLIFLFTILIGFSLNGQTVTTVIEDPFIEVNGEADMEVIPDQVFLSIALKESSDGKQKVLIETLEKVLKEKISSANIPSENLSLVSTKESIEKVAKHKEDHLKENTYLLITEPSSASALLAQLQNTGVKEAKVIKLDHSRMDEFKNEIRLKAVRSARDKADKMIGAIGEVAGKLIFIIEKDNQFPQAQSESELNLMKIKLQYKVVARFEVL